MGYNLFIDSDVVLDFLMERQPDFSNSRQLFEKKVAGMINIYTTASVILNVQYISQKILGKNNSIKLIQNLILLFEFCPTPKDVILKAHNSSFADVEDAVQFYSAVADKSINFFVTCNIKDYKYADEHLKIITSAEAIKILS